MRRAAVMPTAGLGRYPERAEHPGESRDRQLWRALATPFWSQRLALRRGMAFVAHVDALGKDLASAGDEQLAAQLRELHLEVK